MRFSSLPMALSIPGTFSCARQVAPEAGHRDGGGDTVDETGADTALIDDTGSPDPCIAAATTDIDDVPEADWPKGTTEAIAGIQSLVGSWVALADCSGSDFKEAVSVSVTMEADTAAALLYDQSTGCQRVGVLPLSFTSSVVNMGPRTLAFDATFDAQLSSPELVDARYEVASKEFVHEDEHPASTVKSKWESEWLHLELRDSLVLVFGYLETYDLTSLVLSYGGHCQIDQLTAAK